MTAVLVATRADRVAPGDRIDSAGTARTVTSVTSGANRQIYIATVSEGGAQHGGTLRGAVQGQHLHALRVQLAHHAQAHIATADDQQTMAAKARRQGAGTDSEDHETGPGNPAGHGLAARALSVE